MPQHGKSLSIGIVGAGRRRQGLGPFVARFLREEGARVSGVCGRSLESAQKAAEELHRTMGIEARPFADLPTLLRESRPDGLAICSPFEAHKANLLDAASGGVSVLCEKPLVWNEGEDAVASTEEVLAHFAKAKRGIVLNAQWPRTLAAFRELYPSEDFREIRDFEMLLGPDKTGRLMALESVSHPLSILIAFVGPGETEQVSCEYREKDGLASAKLSFGFRHAKGRVACRVHLQTQIEQPRAAWFAVNGKRVDREIRMPGYRFALRGATKTIEIEDPLQLQVRHFLSALRGETPFDSKEALLSHSQGLEALVNANP